MTQTKNQWKHRWPKTAEAAGPHEPLPSVSSNPSVARCRVCRGILDLEQTLIVDGIKKFWYVSRDPSEVPYHDPKKACFSLSQAKHHAEQLVRDTGKAFYIMESILYVEPQSPPVKWTEVDAD